MRDLREYLRDRLKALGYSEWKDEKNIENIPRSKLEQVFHVELSSGTEINQNQVDLVVQLLPVVTLFKIGYRNTSENADLAFDTIKTVIKEVTQTRLAVTQPNIKLIRLESFNLNEINVSNDNIFVMEIVFYCEYIININN